MQGQNSFRGPPPKRSDGLQTASVKEHLQKTFTLRHKSEMDGKMYEGQFTIKKLSIRDLGYIGTRRSQLNGGMYFDETNPGVGIDEGTNATNSMIAHLEVAILQEPIWWNLDEIYDLGLLSAVFEQVINFENSFFRSTRSTSANEHGGSGSDDRNGEGERSGPAGHVKEVGRGEVQPSIDP